VPTPTVSLVDLVVSLEKATTAEAINDAFKKAAAKAPLKGILAYSEEPLVSMDLKEDAHSATVDGDQTMMLGDTFAKVLAWYDNEWAYSVRLADLTDFVAKKL
jgi:glyceraldehyde 3-phosphate dehydrogenase